MAGVWVPSKCTKCGKQVKAGQKAVITATVKTSDQTAYGGYSRGGAGRWSLRINFFANSPRTMAHEECP